MHRPTQSDAGCGSNLLLVSIIIFLSCSKEEQNHLTGEIFYQQRIALTEEAIITIQLVDISKQDVKAQVVAEKIIKNPGQVPIKFDIQYNPGDILPTSTYSLKIKIEEKGSSFFTTDGVYPVINNGITEDIKIKVVPADVSMKRELKKEKRETKEVILDTPKDIDASVNEMKRVSGRWAMGDASSIIDAYYAKDELRLIVEQMDMGDYGSSKYKYYFKDGYLFYHEQNGTRMSSNSDNPDEEVDVNVIMHFNSEGTLVASSKKINYQPVELHDIEAPGVLKHCELIVEIANQNFNQNM